MAPVFSIIIANYNYGRFLEEALLSILSQGMEGRVEIIVCDAGSTDNSLKIIEKYKTHISWWCSEPDGGQSAAFNKGFSHATGRFLTWLNADDVLLPGALKAIADLSEKYPDAEWLTGSSLYADKSLQIMQCFVAHRFSSLRARYGHLMVGGPSSFFTKRLLKAVGGVDESLHYVMDVDLWSKFYFEQHARYRRTKKFIFAYRKHEESKMSGADLSTNERALENRRKSRVESAAVDLRYGKSCAWRKRIVTIVTFSLWDKLLSKLRTRQWRGQSALSIVQ